MRGRLPADMLLPFSQGPLLQSFLYVSADTSGQYLQHRRVSGVHARAAMQPSRMKDCRERLVELLEVQQGDREKSNKLIRKAEK